MFFKWFGAAVVAGFVISFFLWEYDVAYFEQGFTFGFLITMGLWGWFRILPGKLHPLYLKNNPGAGLVRLAPWLAMIWCTFTIFAFGSEKITGVWYLIYLGMGYGTMMLFGLLGARSFGLRVRVDVLERKNFSAALVISAFLLATGMIWGGSMWGESSPESLEYAGIFMIMESYYDGWWIIPLFFAMGWTILFLTMHLWFYREKTVSGEGIRRDRSVADGRAAALYCLACAIPITDAVAGDYYGLADSMIGFSAIALPVLAHEIFRPASSHHERNPQEPWYYVALGFVGMLASPIVSSMLGFR